MSHRTSRSFAGRTPAPPRSLRSATCSTTYICSTLCLQSGFIKEIGPTCTSTDSTHLSAASRCGSLLLSASAGVRSSDDVGAFEGWSCRPNNTQLLEFVKHAFRLRTKLGFILQNAMTSSRERTSAEAEGYRIERALMDCVVPPSKGGDAIHQCPRAESRLLRGIFARAFSGSFHSSGVNTPSLLAMTAVSMAASTCSKYSSSLCSSATTQGWMYSDRSSKTAGTSLVAYSCL